MPYGRCGSRFECAIRCGAGASRCGCRCRSRCRRGSECREFWRGGGGLSGGTGNSGRCERAERGGRLRQRQRTEREPLGGGRFQRAPRVGPRAGVKAQEAERSGGSTEPQRLEGLEARRLDRRVQPGHHRDQEGEAHPDRDVGCRRSRRPSARTPRRGRRRPPRARHRAARRARPTNSDSSRNWRADLGPAVADGPPDADLRRPLDHRDRHDVGDAEPADGQRQQAGEQRHLLQGLVRPGTRPAARRSGPWWRPGRARPG